MASFTRRGFIASTAAAASAAGLKAGPALAQENYPARPIQLICPWGAGGGTDATARIVAALLEKDFGQPVNVVNRTGGSGVVGHSAIATAAPDGYTLGIITVEIAMMHWQGLTELTPTSYTPLALMNEDPPGVQVRRRRPTRRSRSSPTRSRRRRPASSRPPAPARAASGISRWSAGCRRWGSSPTRSPGCRRTAPRPAMQDLAAGGIDIVHLLGAGGARHDRGRQGAEPRGDGAGAQSALPGRADLEGGDRHRLRRPAPGAASPGPKGMPADSRRSSRRR